MVVTIEVDETAPTAVLVLARIGRLHEAFLQEQCAHHDLTSADFRVLALLRIYGEARPVSPTTVAAWVVQTSAGVTATLRRLTERGLVERRQDPADGRGRLVVITATGLDVHRALLARVTDRFAQLTADVDLPATLGALAPLLAAYERHSPRSRPTRGDALTRAAGLADLTFLTDLLPKDPP